MTELSTFYALVPTLLRGDVDIFADGEQISEATVKESLTVQAEGNREVSRKLALYNLDAILSGAGAISQKQMAQQTCELYVDFNQRRKTQEARAADQADETALKALENKIKHCSTD